MKHLKTISCLLVFVLLAGCTLLDEPGNLAVNGNTTQVKVYIGNNARTILPDFDWNFSKYEISAEPIWDNEQDALKPVTIDGTNEWGYIYVPYGNWEIIVTAYYIVDGKEYAVTKGSVKLPVWDKEEKEVVIRLNFPESGGTGTFLYNVRYPEGAWAWVYLSEFGTDSEPEIDEAVDVSGEDVSKAVPSGIYWLTISVGEGDDPPIKRREIVHIYPQLTTRAYYGEELKGSYPADETSPYSILTSSVDYDIVNLTYEKWYYVMKVTNPNKWAVAYYDLAAYKDKQVILTFSAWVKREGAAGMLNWQINNDKDGFAQFPSVGTTIDNAAEGTWYYMSGTWSGIPNNDDPKFYLTTYDNNSDQTTYYVVAFNIRVFEGEALLGSYPAYNTSDHSSLSSSVNYDIVDLTYENRDEVVKVTEPNDWAVALYDLAAFKDIPVTINFSADVKRTGAEGDLVWRLVNSGDYPRVGALIPNAAEGVWYSMSGTWTGPLTDAEPKIYLDSNNNNSPRTTYYVDNFTIDIKTSFELAVGLKGLTTSGGNEIAIDTETGIISREINTGYGSWFNVAIPSDQLPIIPSDTIVISYIGVGDALLSPKKPNSDRDIIPAAYPTFTGDYIEYTYEIPAVAYGESVPTEVVTFQGRPNQAAWKLKITGITVRHGEPIKITPVIPRIRPVAGETPLSEVETLQYTGAVSWSPNVNNNFVEGTSYTATITLTAKAGYTFNGIDADSFSVPGAANVTNAAGGTSGSTGGSTGATMAVTAVFPAAANLAPDILLTFNQNNVSGVGADIVLNSPTVLSAPTGFTAKNTSSYQNAYPYFKVTFGSGYKLSDYTKIYLDVTPINNGYKPIRIAAYGNAPTESLGSTNSNIIAAIESTSGDAIGRQGVTKHLILPINSIPAGADLNEVYIAICVDAATGDQYKIENIGFCSSEPVGNANAVFRSAFETNSNLTLEYSQTNDGISVSITDVSYNNHLSHSYMFYIDGALKDSGVNNQANISGLTPGKHYGLAAVNIGGAIFSKEFNFWVDKE